MSRLYIRVTGITVPNRLQRTEIMKSDALCSQACLRPGMELQANPSFLNSSLCKNDDNDVDYFVFCFEILREYMEMKWQEHERKYKVVKYASVLQTALFWQLIIKLLILLFFLLRLSLCTCSQDCRKKSCWFLHLPIFQLLIQNL